MSKLVTGIAEIVVGAILIVLSIVFPVVAPWLLPLGLSLVLAGIGSLLTADPVTSAGITRSSIGYWQVAYGTCTPNPTLIWQSESGDSNKYLSLVMVLASHPCQAIQQLRLNGKRILLDGGGTSFTPSQSSWGISSITRSGDRVVATLSGSFTGTILTGDEVKVSGISGDPSLNGTWTVEVVDSSRISYTCGGSNITTSGGTVTTTFPDYKALVNMTYCLGSHTSQPFPQLVTDSNGAWGSTTHLLLGHTAICLKLQYDTNLFANGLPRVDAVVEGHNRLYNPVTNSYGFSNNAGVCIYNFLADTVFGFSATPHTDLPDDSWTTAISVCDEPMALAHGGVENRYSCDGCFSIGGSSRGDILRNLLTACGGRLSIQGGQWILQPAAWYGTDTRIGDNLVTVDARCVPWSVAGGINAAISVTGMDLSLPPVAWVNSVTGGDTITVIPQRGLASIGPTVDPDPTVAYPLSGPGGSFPQTIGSISELLGDTWPTTIGNAGVIGAFVDATGVVIGAPLQVGAAGGSWIAPLGAVKIQFGVNDARTWLDNTGSFDLSVTSDAVPTSLDPYQASVAPITYKPKLPVDSLYNGVKAVYCSPLNNFQRSDAPAYTDGPERGFSSDPWLAMDGNNRRWLSSQLAFTKSCSTAQRLSRIALLRIRQQEQMTLTMNASGLALSPLAVSEMTLPCFGFQRKYMEVVGFRLTFEENQDGQGVTMGTSVDFNGTDPSVYDWSTAYELPPQGWSGVPPVTNTSGNPAPPTAAVVTSTSATSATTASGVSTSQIEVTWVTPADAYVTQGGSILIQSKIHTSSTWTSEPSADPSADSSTFGGYSDGDVVDVQIASQTSGGSVSAWVVPTGSPVTVAGAATSLGVGSLSGSGASNGQVLTYDATTSSWTPTTAATTHEEVVTGTIPGTVYGLSAAPLTGTLQFLLNGLLLRPTTDYTASGATVTLAQSTISGDDLYAVYSA